MEDKERVIKFLNELAQLTEKYKIEICGCGCHESPWIEDIETEKYLGGRIVYVKDEKKYIYI